MLKENSTKINRDSDYYDPVRDYIGKPDVEESINYSARCYPVEKNKEKASFCIEIWGQETGCSYKTYDESATAILDAILEDELYDVWKKQHISNMYDSQSDWENE